MITTVLVDRDGTLGGNGHFSSVNAFRPFPGVQRSIYELHRHGISVLCLTNQTRIASGDMRRTELVASMLALGIDDVFVCPHAEDAGCDCRKPRTGLITQARVKYHFSLSEAVLIGDSYRADMQCALNASVQGIHVSTGRAYTNRIAGNFIEADDFTAAVSWLLSHQH